MADVGAQIYDYFHQRGYSPAAAAGIIGNFQQESGLNPQEGGGGLDQGQGSRFHSGGLRQQLDGINGELQGSERATAARLKAAKGPREAALIFSKLFERPGVPMNQNRERYAEEALQRYAGRHVQNLAHSAQLASALSPTAGAAAQPGPSDAQSADLLQLLQASLQPQGSASVAGTALPRPQTSGGPEQAPGTPRVPAALTPQAPQGSTQDTMLALLSKLGQDASPEAAAGQSPEGEPGHLPAQQVAGEHLGQYVNPLPGFTKGRTDQGVDYSAKPGAPIKAIGNAKVLGISPNWYKGQPYVSYELLDGPKKGKVVFVAEQISPRVKAGQRVAAGQTIGTYAPSGTGIEIGLGTHSGGQTLAKATTGYTEGQETDAGKQIRRLLEHLGAR